MPRGILKNARQDASYKHESPNELDTTKATFDRQLVIENTKLNAKLSQNLGTGFKEIEKKKERGEKLSEEEQLKWDECNLLINEMEKSATMKIDEPKTPYEGGFNPNNDYYRTDNEKDDNEEREEIDGNEDEDEEEDDEFALGEGVDDSDDVPKGEIEVIGDIKENKGEGKDEDDEESVELSAAEKHRLFEEKRKMHYLMKAEPLKHPLKVEDEEDEQNEENKENEENEENEEEEEE